MSLTTRDEPSLKAPQTDSSDTESLGSGAERMNDADIPPTGCDVVATLCRMSLVRHRSLSVNGAYARDPPEAPEAPETVETPEPHEAV